MPHSFADIYDAYQGSGLDKQISLADFAKLGNFVTQSNDYDAANNGSFGQTVKEGSYWLNAGLDYTGIPDALGQAGASTFKFFGGTPEVGQQLGHDFLRSVVNYSPMILQGIGEVAAAPETGGASLIPLFASLAGAGALSAADTYEKTGSAKQAAVSGILPAVGAGAGKLAGNLMLPYAQKVLAAGNPITANALQFAGSQAGAIGAMELTGRATGTNQTPFFSVDNLLSMTLGNLPFMAKDVPHILAGKYVPTPSASTPTTEAAQATAKNLATNQAAEQLPSAQDSLDVKTTADDSFKAQMQQVHTAEPETPAQVEVDPLIAQALEQFKGTLEPNAEIPKPETVLGMDPNKAVLADPTIPTPPAKPSLDTQPDLNQFRTDFQTELDSKKANLQKLWPELTDSQLNDVTLGNENSFKLFEGDYKKLPIERQQAIDNFFNAEDKTADAFSTKQTLANSLKAIQNSATPEMLGGNLAEALGKHGNPQEAALVMQQAAESAKAMGMSAKDLKKVYTSEMHMYAGEDAYELMEHHLKPLGDIANRVKLENEIRELNVHQAQLETLPEQSTDSIKTHEDASAAILKANQIAKAQELPPVTDSQLTKRVNQLIADGDAPTTAMVKASVSAVSEAKSQAIEQTKIRKQRSVESLAKSAEGGAKGGRPKKSLYDAKDQAAAEFYANSLEQAKADPNGELAQLLAVVSPAVKNPERFFTKDDSTQMAVDAHFKVMKNFMQRMQSPTFQAKPLEAKLSDLAAGQRTAINRVYVSKADQLVNQRFTEENTNQIEAAVAKALPEPDKSTDDARAMEVVEDHLTNNVFNVLTAPVGVILSEGTNENSVLSRAVLGSALGDKVNQILARYPEMEQSDAVKALLNQGLEKNPAMLRKFLSNLIQEYSNSLARANTGDIHALGSVSNLDAQILRPSPEKVFNNVLLKQGVNTAQAQALTEQFLPKVMQAMTVKDVKFGELINDLLTQDPGRETAGLSTVTGPLRAIWLAATKAGAKGSAIDQARNLAIVMGHENAHAIEHMANNGLLDQTTMDRYSDVLNHFAGNSMQENGRTLQVMSESLLPKEWQKLDALQSMLTPDNPQEAMATAHAIWTMASAAKEADAAMGMAIVPREVRGWFQTVADWGRKLVGAVKSMLLIHPENGDREIIKGIVDNFQGMKNFISQAENQVQEFNGFFQADQETMNPLKLSQVSLMQPSVGVGPDGMVRMASRETGPKTIGDKIARQGSRFFEGLEQLAERFKTVSDYAYAALEAPIHLRRITDKILSPIVTEPDGQGGFKVLGKDRQKQLDLVMNNTDVNRLTSDIKLWEQKELDQGRPTLFDLANPKNSDQGLANRLAQMTPEAQSAIKGYLGAQRDSNKIAQSYILDSFNKENTLHLATLLASKDNNYRPQAKDIAGAFMQEAEMRTNLAKMDPNDPQAAMAQQQLAQMQQANMQLIPNPEIQATMRDMANTFMDGQTKMADTFAARPNFGSRIVTGSHIIRGFDATGKMVGAEPIKAASQEDTAQAILKKKGAVKFTSEQIKRKWDISMDDDMKAAIDHAQGSWMQKLINSMGPGSAQAITEFADEQPLTAEFDRLNQAGKIIQPGSRAKTTMDSIDMVEAHRAYASILARMLTNRLTKANMAFEVDNPALAKFPEQVQQVKDAFEAFSTPDSELGRSITKMMAVYYLGANLPTDLAVAAHGLFTTMPELVSRNGSIVGSTKLMLGALKDLGGYYTKNLAKGLVGKAEWDSWDNPKEAQMLGSMKEAGLLHNHAYSDAFDPDGLSAVQLHQLANKGIVAKAGDLAGSAWKSYSDLTMKIFGFFTSFNSRLASLVGYRQALADGLNHENASDYAMKFNRVVTMASGKIGRPVGWFSGKDHTIGQVATCMQRYLYGCMSMMARYAQHGYSSPEAAAEMGVSPTQQKAASKALMTMMGIRFGAAGILGMPFVGALNALLEKTTGFNAGEQLYKAFGSTMDQDDQEGSMIADVATHGFVNALLARTGVPVDMASKFTMAGVPGLSSTDVFDPNSIFGPSASFMKSMVTGINGYAKDGNLVNVGKSALPPAFRKVFDLWANGDATDTKGNPEGLNDLEKTLYAIGFPSQRQAKTREFKHYADLLSEQKAGEQKRDVAKLMDLYNSGDVDGARNTMMQIVQDSGGTKNPQTLASAVAKGIVDKSSPPDPRQGISAANALEASQIMKGMGLPLTASGQLMRQMAMQQISRSMGGGMRQARPNFGGPMGRASMIDEATAADPLQAFQMPFALPSH